MPADEVRVKVWVVQTHPAGRGSAAGTAPPAGLGADGGSLGEVTLLDENGRAIARQSQPGVELASTSESAKRDTPEWWDDAKFGIL